MPRKCHALILVLFILFKHYTRVVQLGVGPYFPACFDTVGWVVLSRKNPVPDMTIVFGGTFNITKLNCSLREQLQMSTTHSRFDQYCISQVL